MTNYGAQPPEPRPYRRQPDPYGRPAPRDPGETGGFGPPPPDSGRSGAPQPGEYSGVRYPRRNDAAGPRPRETGGFGGEPVGRGAAVRRDAEETTRWGTPDSWSDPGGREPYLPPARRRKHRGARTALLVLAIVVLVGGLAALGGAFVLNQRGDTPAAAGQHSPPAPTPAASGPQPSSPAGAAGEFTFSAVGDTIVASPDAPPDNAKGFFDDVKPALAADLQFANLEEAVTDDTGVRKCSAGSSQCHAFRAPPACAQALVEAGFKIVSLANNHANDFGATGLKNTKSTLDSLGITYTGPPGLIPVVTVNGVKVAMLAFSPYAWSNDLNNIPAAAALVKQATGQADVVIVTAHVGAEGSDKTHVKPGIETFAGETRGDSIAFSHAVVDAGADLVVLQGPHVMRGMEYYKGKLIDYSMGNFAGYRRALVSTGVLGISGILRVTMGADGSVKAAKLVATSLVDPGYPRMDPKQRAIAQVRSLTRADFPTTGPTIADDGTITPPAA